MHEEPFLLTAASTQNSLQCSKTRVWVSLSWKKAAGVRRQRPTKNKKAEEDGCTRRIKHAKTVLSVFGIDTR